MDSTGKKFSYSRYQEVGYHVDCVSPTYICILNDTTNIDSKESKNWICIPKLHTQILTIVNHR